MKHMILGGGGVFGNLTAKHLLEKGHEVIAIGRSPLKPCFHLDVGKGNQKYQYHQLHIVSEQAGLFNMMASEKPDCVINFAALAYANSWEQSELYYRTNTLTVVQMAEFLKGKSWLKRFIQIGSSEVYGSTGAPALEDGPVNPTSPYAVSKLAADMHLITMKKHLPINIIRPSNCYGEGQYAYRIIPKTILYLLTGRVFPLEGGGVAEKSFMHADDLANAIEAVFERGAGGEVYNVGPDKPISMRDLVQLICRQMRKPMNEFTYDAPGRAVEDSRYWVDSSKIKALGWEEKTRLEDGIAGMIEWCREYKDALLREPDRFTLRA